MLNVGVTVAIAGLLWTVFFIGAMFGRRQALNGLGYSEELAVQEIARLKKYRAGKCECGLCRPIEIAEKVGA